MTHELKNAEANWFEEVLDAISDLVLVKDPNSRMLWANRAFREYYGLSNDALRHLIDGGHCELTDTLQYLKDDQRVIMSGKLVHIPAEPMMGADGTVRHFHTIKTPIIDSSGSIVRQVGVSRPVVDTRLEALLNRVRTDNRTSLRNMRTLVRAMPTPVVMFDALHRLIAWSESFVDLAAQIIGEKPDNAALFESDYATVFEAKLPLIDELDRTFAGGEQQEKRVATLDAGGENERRLEVVCRLWTNAAGDASGTIALLYDVTELYSARERLEAANDELTQFNYRVSHDLVAPISTARGLIGIAEEDAEAGEYEDLQELLHDARVQLEVLDKLVSDLMDLARVDVPTEEPEMLDLADMIGELETVRNTDMNSARPALRLHLEVAQLIAEPVRIRQILTNLLSNADKFIDTAEAEPVIDISSRYAGDSIVIEVSDNGIGIDEALRDRLFKLFARGRSEHAGHGVGLHIVWKHVVQLGGSVRVTHLRKPTVFEIRLPDVQQLAA